MCIGFESEELSCAPLVRLALSCASPKLWPLSPRGPHASRAREGNSGGEDLFGKRRACPFSR
jgi:hypothetical protein